MLRLLAAAGCVLVLAGCTTATTEIGPDPDGLVPPVPEPPVSASRAERLLAELPQAPRPWRGPSYDRDAFGTPWADTDGNGCNQRDDVLLRDAVPGSAEVARRGGCDHDVLAGTWDDPYSGRTLTFDDLKDLSQAQAIQIDHVVPLAEAWRSGAAGWSAERRRRYANDLPGLLAVDGPTNAAKSDGDPAAWRPRAAYQCAYARRWVAVKGEWGLAVDDSEVAALEEMLARC